MNKKKILIFNWKNNIESKKKALDVFSKIKQAKEDSGRANLDFMVVAPSVYLDAINIQNQNKKIKISSIDISDGILKESTGGLSIAMLKDLGVKNCVIGHPERRKKLSESSKNISQKVDILLRANMSVIICVGEEKRDSKGYFADVLRKQILDSLESASLLDAEKITLAYMPAWAESVGSKKVSLDQIEQSIFLIRKILKEKFKQNSEKVRVVYGGNIDEENSSTFLQIFGLDGFLLERASTDPKVFTKIIKNIQ
jgi:triosephosphate isomerase